MDSLINRLRTGTHEQAVGLLRECYQALVPHFSDVGVAGSEERHEAILHKANFERLLNIGTPEACVGAAMMLIPDECCIERMGEVPDNPEPSRWHCVLWREDENVPANPYPGEEASTSALALAAAIMETKNV